MNRALYLTGCGYVAVSALVLALQWRQTRVVEPHITVPAAQFGGSGAQWFAAIKPYCNAVEVELQERQHPAPGTTEGAGYSAACYALAGKIDQARAVIQQLPAGERYKAAGIVFDVGHPVADAGDDRSAGPIMELVLEYWPNHYMALYHAGMSEYILGHRDLSRTHLESFLKLYAADDGWRKNAVAVLGRLTPRPLRD